MTEFLIAAFVIMLLVGLVIVSAVAAFLNLLAGKDRAAIPWALGFIIGIGLLISTILGGF